MVMYFIAHGEEKKKTFKNIDCKNKFTLDLENGKRLKTFSLVFKAVMLIL